MLRISIIIPIYNVEKYIVRCLESVVAQKHEDFEIECILVDDCSPDKSMEIAESFVESHKSNVHFVFLKQKTNKGQSAARNEAIRKSTGDYVFFLDSDDYIYPDSLFVMVKALDNLPNADFVEGSYHSGRDNRTYPHKRVYLEYTNQKEMLQQLYKGNVSHLAWNKLIRRKIITDNSLFFVEGIIFEDIQWTHRLYHLSSSAIIIPDVTYEYVYNPKSTSTTSDLNATKSLNSFVYVLNSFLDTKESYAFVDHKLFVFHYILNAMDIQMKGTADKKSTIQLAVVKKRLMGQTLSNGRLILATFFLLMFNPFSYLLNSSVFRRSIYWIEKVVSGLANMFNWLHDNR